MYKEENLRSIVDSCVRLVKRWKSYFFNKETALWGPNVLSLNVFFFFINVKSYLQELLRKKETTLSLSFNFNYSTEMTFRGKIKPRTAP